MFERDYLMRILQTFFKDLDELLHGKHYPDDEEQLEAIGDLYREYMKNGRGYFYELSAGDLVAYNEDPDSIYKAEMLATLLYQDALLQKDIATKKALLDKSLALYQFINLHSKDFSLERTQMIDTIKKALLSLA